MRNLYFHIYIIVACLLRRIHGSWDKNIEGVIIPGLNLEETLDPNTVYYDKLVPIVLEFKTFPGLTAPTSIAGRSRILPAKLACRNEDRPYSTISVVDWTFTCPISYHMTNLLSQLYANWTDISTNSRGLGVRFSNSEFQQFSNPELSFDECESQLRYWRGINNRDGGLAELKTVFDKCAMTNYFEEQISDFSSPINPVYEQMRDNFVLNFFGNGSSSSVGTGGDMLATLVALQSFMTLNFYAEITRWRDAIASCQNNLIPNSIVKPNRIEKALADIRSKLTPMKFSPSVTTMSKFYKMPIADCIMGQTSFFVRIMIPVKKDKTMYRAIRVNQPRFLYDDELCQVTSMSKSDGAFPLTTSGYLIEKLSNTLVLAGCDNSRNRRGGQMCKIPDRTNTPPSDKCLTSVCLENIIGIKTYCRLDCEKVVLPSLPSAPLVELPIIHRIEPSKFIITLNTITSILIKCESVGLPDQMIPPQKYGAVEVTLPCECFIMFHADKYFPYEPCTSISISDVAIHHALPLQMVNASYDSYIANRLQPWNVNPRASYYGRRKITFPNVTLYINMTFKDEDVVESDLFDSSEYFDNGTLEPGAGDGDAETEVNSHIVSCCVEEGSGNHGFIWTIVIIQLILTFVLIGFFIFKVRVLERKLEQGQGGTRISFSNAQSQLTLTDKFVEL